MSVLDVSIGDGIARLCLNRPQVHNAVTLETMEALEAALDQIEADASIRVIILTGAGEKSFSSGGDLRYFSSLTVREEGEAMSLRMQAILNRLHLGDRVVIAAINGDAYGGGCEIITACHIRLAVESARFAFRQAVNGVVTGWGGGLRLLQQLGRGPAMRLLLTSERIDAAEAERVGLIDDIVTREELETKAMELALKILGNSQLAVTSFLRLDHAVHGVNREAIAALETSLFADCWVGEDFRNTLAKYGPKS